MIALYSISQTYCHVKQFLCIEAVPPLGLILIIPLLGQTFTIVRGAAADYQPVVRQGRVSMQCGRSSLLYGVCIFVFV